MTHSPSSCRLEPKLGAHSLREPCISYLPLPTRTTTRNQSGTVLQTARIVPNDRKTVPGIRKSRQPSVRRVGKRRPSIRSLQ